MREIGVGIAGMGFMARMHSRALSRIPNTRVVAAWSKFPHEHERFREFTRKLGLEVSRYYVDLNQFLEDPEIDAVICAIPWKFIYPIAREIIQNGKPVLLECPPGATPAEIDKLNRLARARGAPVMPGHCYRFAPCFRKVKELISKLGRPELVSFRELVPAASLARQWAPDSWIWKKEHGGPLPTMTVFAMDLARWLAESEASTLYASLSLSRLKSLRILGYATTITIRFKNGTVWNSEFTNLVNEARGSLMNLEVMSERYVTRVTSPEHVELFTEKKREWMLELERPERWGHQDQDLHFINDVVSKGKPPAVTLKDAEKAFRLSLAALRSARQNRPVRL